MRVLILCNKAPYPSLEGGSMAMDAVIRGLSRSGVELDILAVDSLKFPAGPLPEDVADTGRVSYHTAPVRLNVRPLPALWNLLLGRSYHVARFRSQAFRRALTDLLERHRYEIVQFETPFLGRYLPLVRKRSAARVILRAHNIEHRIWERLAATEKNALKRRYLLSLARSLRRFEARLARSVDGIAAITAQDAAWFREETSIPVISFPFGMEVQEDQRAQPAPPGPQVFHLGSMNWLPNEEGVRWLLDEVWPRVIRQQDTAELHLAGRGMPEWLSHGRWEGVQVHGEVPDAGSFMRQYGIMAVPLRSGSGMRVKIIEGMLAGRAVVSTRVGAEGIQCTHGQHLLIADEPEAMAEAILRLISNPELRASLGRAAHQLALGEYDNHLVIRRLTAFYELLNQG